MRSSVTSRAFPHPRAPRTATYVRVRTGCAAAQRSLTRDAARLTRLLLLLGLFDSRLGRNVLRRLRPGTLHALTCLIVRLVSATDLVLTRIDVVFSAHASPFAICIPTSGH